MDPLCYTSLGVTRVRICARDMLSKFSRKERRLKRLWVEHGDWPESAHAGWPGEWPKWILV